MSSIVNNIISASSFQPRSTFYDSLIKLVTFKLRVITCAGIHILLAISLRELSACFLHHCH